MRVTGLYAALCAVLVVFLALRVVQQRLRKRVGVGDAGDPDLIRRIRAHGNAVENVPTALLLLLLLDLGNTASAVVHAFGLAVLAGRLAHAWGLSRSSGPSPARFAGSVLTWGAMLGMAGLLLWQFAGLAAGQ